MINKNLITWIILVLLTSTNYLIPGKIDGNTILFMLILLTSVKVLLVAYKYMELKMAHPAWLLALVFILIIYSSFTISLNL